MLGDNKYYWYFENMESSKCEFKAVITFKLKGIKLDNGTSIWDITLKNGENCLKAMIRDPTSQVEPSYELSMQVMFKTL